MIKNDVKLVGGENTPEADVWRCVMIVNGRLSVTEAGETKEQRLYVHS